MGLCEVWFVKKLIKNYLYFCYTRMKYSMEMEGDDYTRRFIFNHNDIPNRSGWTKVFLEEVITNGEVVTYLDEASYGNTNSYLGKYWTARSSKNGIYLVNAFGSANTIYLTPIVV